MTTAFLYKDSRWSVSERTVPLVNEFRERLWKCKSIPQVCINFPHIKSSIDYNELIAKLQDPSLRGKNIMRSFVSPNLFQGAVKLKPSNYPINHNLHQSQLYHNNNGKSSILLFFAGYGRPELSIDTRFGIPLLAFHAKYSNIFGSIAYFYESELFDYEKLIKKINAVFATIPNHGKIILMGCSAGGYLPIILKNKFNIYASFSFSPIFTRVFTKEQFREKNFINSHSCELSWSRRMKIFYSEIDSRDVEFVEYCKLNMSKDVADKVFENLSDINPAHNTLLTLHESGILDQKLKSLEIN